MMMLIVEENNVEKGGQESRVNSESGGDYDGDASVKRQSCKITAN